jgi:hypothetical protein
VADLEALIAWMKRFSFGYGDRTVTRESTSGWALATELLRPDDDDPEVVAGWNIVRRLTWGRISNAPLPDESEACEVARALARSLPPDGLRALAAIRDGALSSPPDRLTGYHVAALADHLPALRRLRRGPRPSLPAWAAPAPAPKIAKRRRDRRVHRCAARIVVKEDGVDEERQCGSLQATYQPGVGWRCDLHRRIFQRCEAIEPGGQRCHMRGLWHEDARHFVCADHLSHSGPFVNLLHVTPMVVRPGRPKGLGRDYVVRRQAQADGVHGILIPPGGQPVDLEAVA